MYRYIEPEVAGGLGDYTKMDASVHPPVIHQIEYKFDGWLENDIVESFPCYIVTDRLKKAIELLNCSGCIFEDVLISKSTLFEELYGNRELPTFYWLKVTGYAGEDDFGIAQDYRLVISDKVFQVLSTFNVSAADFEPFH